MTCARRLIVNDINALLHKRADLEHICYMLKKLQLFILKVSLYEVTEAIPIMAHALPEETILASEDPKPNPQLDSATDSAETVLDSHDSDHEAETAPAGSLLRNGEGSIDGAVTTEERSSMRMEDPDRAGRVWVCCPARGCGFRVSYIVGLFLTAFGCVSQWGVSKETTFCDICRIAWSFRKCIHTCTMVTVNTLLHQCTPQNRRQCVF